MDGRTDKTTTIYLHYEKKRQENSALHQWLQINIIKLHTNRDKITKNIVLIKTICYRDYELCSSRLSCYIKTICYRDYELCSSRLSCYIKTICYRDYELCSSRLSCYIKTICYRDYELCSSRLSCYIKTTSHSRQD
jgi:hypothetical protein